MKKLFAGMSAVAISLTQVGSVFAAYSDVPAGVWYEEAVTAFTDAGYLATSQTRFRGGDNANRAEFIKLVVELEGGILSTPPAVPSFADVATGAWYYGYMEEAAKEGWLKGDGDCYVTGTKPCNARPGANVNRAEAAALIVRAFALESTGDAPDFVDVPAGQWYSSVMQTAADNCVLQGDEATGRARPSDSMNRAEMVVMLNRVDMGLTYGVDCTSGTEVTPAIKDVTPLAADSIEVRFAVAVDETVAADKANYAISGDADIAVSSVKVVDETTVELTLAESTDADGNYTVTVTDMETAAKVKFSDSMDFSGYTEIVIGDGILEVSVASSSPKGDTVPKGAYGVVMLSLDLTASCDDSVTIEEMTVLHDGFGDSSDIAGVYVAVDGGRISRRRSLTSSDQTAVLRLTSSLVIPACKTKTVDLVADIDSLADTGGEHSLALEAKTDIQSNAKEVKGSLPAQGNSFKIASVSSGDVTLTYKNVSPSTVDVGTSKVKVGKYEISADSEEDQALYSITLEQTGSASDGDITNLRLISTNNTVLTNTVAQATSDYVTLTFDPPRVVLAGESLNVELVGDIVGGAADTVKFELEEESDLFAVGSLYGKGKSGQLFGSPVTKAGTVSTVTLTAGQLTVEVDGPAQKKYTEDSSNATLAKVIFTPGAEAVDIRSVSVYIRATDSGSTAYTTAVTDAIEDVALRNTKTGVTISATTVGTVVTGGYQEYKFEDFGISKQETYELQVDFITGGPDSGDRFQVYVNSDDAVSTSPAGIDGISAEGVTTGKALTDIRPGSVVSGSVHLVISPNVTVAVRSIGSTDTTVRKAENVTLLRFDVTPGEAVGVEVRGVVVEDAGSTNLLNAQNYALWVDSDGDTTVDTILEKGAAPSAADGTVSFNDIMSGNGYPVAAQATVIFEVRANIASNPPTSTLQIAFASLANGGIEMVEEDTGTSIANADITLNTTVTSKTYTIVTQGDLFVKTDSKPASRQLLAGTLADSVLRMEMNAQYEDVRVDTIRIAATGATAAAVSQLELFQDNETTKFATLSPCTVTVESFVDEGTSFCTTLGTSTLVVKKNTPVIITVRPRLNNDLLGVTASKGVTFWTGSGGIIATGVQSSGELRMNDEDGYSDGEVVFGRSTPGANVSITGNANDIVLAKYTAIANKLPARGLPSGTDQEIARFEFTAPTNLNTSGGANSATLSGIIFTVASSNMNFDSIGFKMYKTTDTANKITCTTLNPTASGALKVQCLDTASVDTEVKSGQSLSFSLEADIDSNDVTPAANSTLQVSIANFSSQSATSFAQTTSNISWSDGSAAYYWVESAETTIFSTQMTE